MLDVDIAGDEAAEGVLMAGAFEGEDAAEGAPIVPVSEYNPVYTPPEGLDTEVPNGDSTSLYKTALEWDPEQVFGVGMDTLGTEEAEPYATPAGTAELRVGVDVSGVQSEGLDALKLSSAAQQAQSEHAEQRTGDGPRVPRQESFPGQGPFEGKPLEPQTGKHCISILVCFWSLSGMFFMQQDLPPIGICGTFRTCHP
jgi:hypothetical protein